MERLINTYEYISQAWMSAADDSHYSKIDTSLKRLVAPGLPGGKFNGCEENKGLLTYQRKWEGIRAHLPW